MSENIGIEKWILNADIHIFHLISGVGQEKIFQWNQCSFSLCHCPLLGYQLFCVDYSCHIYEDIFIVILIKLIRTPVAVFRCVWIFSELWTGPCAASHHRPFDLSRIYRDALKLAPGLYFCGGVFCLREHVLCQVPACRTDQVRVPDISAMHVMWCVDMHIKSVDLHVWAWGGTFKLVSMRNKKHFFKFTRVKCVMVSGSWTQGFVFLCGFSESLWFWGSLVLIWLFCNFSQASIFLCHLLYPLFVF